MADLPLARRLELGAWRPDTSRADLERLAAEARRFGCLALGVCGSRVELAATLLEDSPVKVSALVGFPFGTSDPDVKRLEVEAAIEAGAQELECVMNHGWLRDGNDRAVLREWRDLREAAEERPVKAVVELALLNPDELRRAVALVRDAELQFLVTATGCAARPTTVEDVARLRDWSGSDLGLKVVGGLAGRGEIEALIAAGANRAGVFDLGEILGEP